VLPGLHTELCKLLRHGPGNHPRKNRVSPARFFLPTPDYDFRQPAYDCMYQKEEFALPGGDAMGFPCAGTRKGRQ
jgi:hypothetical protein